jgi:hypothetical protein
VGSAYGARIRFEAACTPIGTGPTRVTTAAGRFTALMPHPERVFRNLQLSWTSGDPGAFSAWMQIWRNARNWVGWRGPTLLARSCRPRSAP